MRTLHTDEKAEDFRDLYMMQGELWRPARVILRSQQSLRLSKLVGAHSMSIHSREIVRIRPELCPYKGLHRPQCCSFPIPMLRVRPNLTPVTSIVKKLLLKSMMQS
jgi:hypothetical protein